MSTNLEPYIWPTSFACSLVTNNILLPNHYTITVGIHQVDPVCFSLGFTRLKTFIDNFLHNSIFIFQSHELTELFLKLDTNVVKFPTEPYDHFVGCVLLRKFQSITYKYFEIEHITIDSAIGDNVQYCIRDPEETGLELSGEQWWNNEHLDTGKGISVSWTDLDLQDGPKFEPRIVKGGRSENE